MHVIFTLAKYRLDAALLIAIAMGAMLVLHRWARYTHGGRGVPPAAWVALVASLAMGIGLAERLADQTRFQLRSMLQGFAATYASELERLGHANVANDAAPNDPLYLRLVETEKRWLAINPAVHDIYTFRKLANGQVILLVDSETDYDGNGRYEGEREERTPIGEEYPDEPSIERAFAGEPVFDNLPAQDRWGTWVSASVPLHDAAGRVEAVLGVDYAADSWVRAIDGSRMVGLGIGALLSAILIGIVAFVITTRSELAQRLKNEEALRQSEMALGEARDAAVASAQQKGEFLANMSHEIRTPMNGVMGLLGLLRDTDLTTDQREQVAMAFRSAEQLLTILNDILDFSKIESGKLRIEQAPFDLVQTVDEVVRLLAPAAGDKGIRLESHYHPDAPQYVLGDSGRIRQILTNIIGNAIKFTAQGGVTLRVFSAKHDGDVATFSLVVSDTGIGIPADKLDLIFDKFSQADASTTRRFGGTGLGLAISRQLAELMQGSIEVTSVMGQGSTFTVTLPLRVTAAPAAPARPTAPRAKTTSSTVSSKVATVDPATQAASSVPARTTPGNGLHVLVADDNLVNQRVAARMLERLGCQVDVAWNGMEAVELVQQRLYAIVFLDGQMPEMDGMQASAAIRKLDGPASRTPLVAMTAHALAGDRERYLAAGMDDYIAKPVSLAEMERVLGKFGR